MWIARDRFNDNHYRVFMHKPLPLAYVNMDGDTVPWTTIWGTKKQASGNTHTDLSPSNLNVVDESQSPVILLPGEGPIEVKLSCANPPSRPFEGEGI